MTGMVWCINVCWLDAAWLSVCRVTAIIALVLQLVSAVLFIVLVVCGVCRSVSCPDYVQDQLCQRVLLYATPITAALAGMSTTLDTNSLWPRTSHLLTTDFHNSFSVRFVSTFVAK